MRTCEFCKVEPVITNHVLVHKCKQLTLMISDANNKVIVKKWDRIQAEYTFKDIFVDS